MKLDSVRNHIMLVNLWLSMMSISLMLVTVPPAIMGMNMRHGLEDIEPGPFYWVTGLSLAMGVLSLPWMFISYKRGWRLQSERDLGEVNRLRVMLVRGTVARGIMTLYNIEGSVRATTRHQGCCDCNF